jgi:outer membrane protein assembly factor BamE (lipoprotein component of BamABCDE complex)
MNKTRLSILCGSLLLAACQPTIASRGNIIDADALAEIKPGTTTREEVATRLGTPTSISTFDDKVWYYVGRETEQYSFLDPEVMKQQAVEIDFDDKGIVTAKNNLDLSKAADVDAEARSTPTYGQQYTIWRELLGDLSHPMPDLSGAKHPGQ